MTSLCKFLLFLLASLAAAIAQAAPKTSEIDEIVSVEMNRQFSRSEERRVGKEC